MLSAILVSCGLQKPAPVLLKGEEFYGKRDLEYTREYHVIREDVDPSIKKKVEKSPQVRYIRITTIRKMWQLMR
jgi:lipoprotein NlpD